MFFEVEALKILGKKIDDSDVKRFIKDIKEIPEIDEDFLGLPNDNIAYYFLKSGIILMFRKGRNILTSIRFYFISSEKFERFSGFYNLIMNNSSSKKSIIKSLGDPTREKNVIDYSYGKKIPKWMCYDYKKYTLRCAFYGDEDKLAEVALMTPEAAPGRVL